MLREGYLTWLSDTASFFITIITIWRCNCWKQKTWSITQTRHVLSARTNWGWYIRWSTLVPRARRTAIRRSSDSRSKRWKITRHLSIRKDRAVDIGYMNHKDTCSGCPCFHRIILCVSDIFYQWHNKEWSDLYCPKRRFSRRSWWHSLSCWRRHRALVERRNPPSSPMTLRRTWNRGLPVWEALYFSAQINKIKTK